MLIAENRIAQHGARTFALLYVLESAARATFSSVIPIQAYDILQSERSVSLLYTAVSVCGLFTTLFIPLLIARFGRRRMYLAGALALAASAIVLAHHSLAGQAAGMFLRVVGGGALSVTLNLFIMSHIRKADFMGAESLRFAVSTIAWTIGPVLGVFVYARWGIGAVSLIVALFAFALFAFFQSSGLADEARPGKTVGPLRAISRFAAQPRLRLAWLIAFGRSSFWTTLYVYGPLLMVVTGQGKLAGGLLISLANALLAAALLWGRAGQVYGARAIIAGCFAAMALFLVLAGIAGEAWPLAAAGLLLAASFFAVAHDALGSTPFLRAVHAYERPQMSAVYRTYIDVSDLLPPLIYAAVLSFTGIGGVFITLGLFLLVCAWVSWRHLPKSM